MRDTVIQKFREVYGYAPQYIVRAPGRANLIGGHTDYNEGFTLPLAIDRAIYIAFAKRPDRGIRAYSMDFGGEMIEHDEPQKAGVPHWAQHVHGIWWILARDGITVPGADLVIGGDIPMGAGVSSSAAIGVGVVEMALQLADAPRTQREKALLAVKIEHEYLGVPCGVLDQMASAVSPAGSAVLLDCRTLETTPVAIPEGVYVVVIDSKKSRELAASGYAERRAQCEKAAAIMGVPALRDADMALLDAHREELGDLLYRRARHIITENARVLQMKDALTQGDLVLAGQLLNATHASLRDDYEISVRELDILCELASQHPACYGVRLMGGGFGGSAVGLVAVDGIEAFVEYLKPRYAQQTGLTPDIIVCQPAAGSSVDVVNA